MQIECNGFEVGKGPAEWVYGKVPLVVSRDLRLSRLAISVYVELAWACWATAPLVELGGELVAKRLRVSKYRVYRAVKELVRCGHIERYRDENGKRAVYRMRNAAFEPLAQLGPKMGKPPKLRKAERKDLPDGVKSAPRGWKKEKAG